VPRPRSIPSLALAATVVASLAGVGGAVTQHQGGHPQKAKNVIFIQGDGMGIAHRELIRLGTYGHTGRELAMDTLRYAGWTHTDSADPDAAVTDSAAAATSFASGVKTYNGAVGVDATGRSVPTLLERARALGKATGLVTTAQVTDASPAAFGAHVPDRADQSEIARQFLVDSRPDVILGGGEDWWLPAGTPGDLPDNPATDPTEQSKGTEGNLVARAEALGYDHVSTRDELRASHSRKLLGLFSNEEMFEQRNEGLGDIYAPAVPLPEMATKALDVLSRDRDGFFLFLEEEGIDEFAHSNNAHKTLAAGQALDRTVAVAKAFAARHPGTLILVVGDHETGGLAIENLDAADESGGAPSGEDGPFPLPGTTLTFSVDWTTNQHTGGATPITADGPGAARLGRVQQNTAVHDAVLAAMTGQGSQDT
jgi:alkaline phosphatase